MTSQNSSMRNKASIYDLRYSFKTTFAVPLALLVLRRLKHLIGVAVCLKEDTYSLIIAIFAAKYF